jgi:UDP-N-acetylmuramate dehydrogenase
MSVPPLRFDVPLGRYTTFGIGGRARYFVEARSSGRLREAIAWGRESGMPVFVLGRGSNVLIGDGGFEGLVIRTARSEGIELLPGNRIRAESGVQVERLVGLAAARGLSGLEHFAGIPSTLGGALWQNLHFLSPDRSRLMFLGELVEEATVLEGETVHRVSREWFEFGYDASTLRSGTAILLDATLRLTPADPAVVRAAARANLTWRARRHPRGAATRSAGCVFRNPPGSSAARAIDAAGLKGRTVGGAAVARRHANFIVNTGGATAHDVRTLIDLVAGEVAAHSGLRLEPELALVGTFPHPAASAG